VADDLLKNDGKKFIEMMEQLAERRMQREEEAQYAAATHPSSYDYRGGHSHAAPEDEDEEDYDDEEYDSEEGYDESEEDMVK
jgi:phage regulator Rha-like protein